MAKSNLAIIGGGSWATALVKIFSTNNSYDSVAINWWVYEKEIIEHFKRYKHNPIYLRSVKFDINKIFINDNLEEIVGKSSILILAVPSIFVKDILSKITQKILKDKITFSAIKGIIPEDNVLVNEFLNVKYDIPVENTGIIAGPCHAEEIALERLTYITVASENLERARTIAKLFECRYIKTEISEDVQGIGYAVVLKNIFAIASGICHSLGYGDNFQAVLISNAMKELNRFLSAIDKYSLKRNLCDSVYLGDIIVTSYSQFSRNRLLGSMLGKGYSVKSALAEMDNMIAEGCYGVKCIKDLVKQRNLQIDLPITDAVYHILYEKISPVLEMKLLAEKLK